MKTMAMAGQGIVNNHAKYNHGNQGGVAPGKNDYNKRGSDLKKAG